MVYLPLVAVVVAATALLATLWACVVINRATRIIDRLLVAVEDYHGRLALVPLYEFPSEEPLLWRRTH